MLAATGEQAVALRCALYMLAASNTFQRGANLAGTPVATPLDLIVESLGGVSQAGGSYLAASGATIAIGTTYALYATVSERDYEQVPIGLGAWGARGLIAFDCFQQNIFGDDAASRLARVRNFSGGITADLNALRGQAVPNSGGMNAFYNFFCKADGPPRVLDETGELAAFSETTILLTWSSP